MGELSHQLMAEILRDAHRYAPGLEPNRPTNTGADPAGARKFRAELRDRSRDLIERAGSRARFIHRHYDPDTAAERLLRILDLEDGLQATYDRLADEASRRALLDVLKLRVLGPFHSPLPVTAQAYRDRQTHVERDLQVRSDTFTVSDPWFSPLSLYRVRLPGGTEITLHSHSVDIVSVFVLGQYGLTGGPYRTVIEPGTVALDVGGCWGDTALLLADKVGPKGKVFTFEFDPENLAVMHANLEANPRLAERIEIVERAVWEHSGEQLPFVGAGRATLVLESSAPEETGSVSTVSLDDFAEQAGIDRLGFIKMDVEGAELGVLKGARDVLTRWMPDLAIAAYHRDDDLVCLPGQIGPGYALGLASYSPLEDETVLYATPAKSST